MCWSNNIYLFSNPLIDCEKKCSFHLINSVRNFHSTKPVLITAEAKAVLNSKVVVGLSIVIGTTVVVSQIGTDAQNIIIADTCKDIVMNKSNATVGAQSMADAYANCVQKARKTADWVDAVKYTSEERKVTTTNSAPSGGAGKDLLDDIDSKRLSFLVFTSSIFSRIKETIVYFYYFIQDLIKQRKKLSMSYAAFIMCFIYFSYQINNLFMPLFLNVDWSVIHPLEPTLMPFVFDGYKYTLITKNLIAIVIAGIYNYIFYQHHKKFKEIYDSNKKIN